MEGQINKKTPTFFSLTGIRYRGQNYIKLAGFPDTSTYKNGEFIFKNSFSNIEYALEQFPDIEWVGETKTRAEEYAKFKIEEATNNMVKESHEKHEPVDMGDCLSKTKPFKHQLKTFNVSKRRKNYGIFFEQGCGKTKVIIDTARYLFDINEIKTLVVIAPNGVHDNWIDDELPIHLYGEYFGMAWRSGFNKTQKKLWDKIGELKTILKIYSFNVETFKSEKNQAELIRILEADDCMLVIDESQKIKNPSAKRTKFLCKAGQLAKYRRILTGTPITKGAEDFYSQFKFLDPNIIGITAFSGFKNRYCIMGGWEYKQIVSYRNVNELQEKVKNHSVRVLKKDCLDLPEKLYQFTPFDLSIPQKKMIDQVKKEGVIELKGLENNAMIIDHVMTRLVKIQQISNGYLLEQTDKGERVTHEIIPANKNPRLLKLKETLNQIEGKVVIWTRYIYDVELISQILPKGRFVKYDGGVSVDDRKINKRRFLDDPNCDYFLVNLQTGSTGLTLVASHHNIYYNNSYDLELRLQSEDRTHRIGTKFNVVYNDFIANKTPEKKIITALKKKKAISDLILQDPTSLFLEETK